MSDYIHAATGMEMILAATIFKVMGDGRLAYGNRNLLYVEGLTTVGSACCGAIECRLIRIPGFLVSWHYKTDAASDNPVSQVEPITDPSILEDVKKLLFKTFPSALFIFS